MIVYVYVLDTLADWEIGNVTAEINSKRFFKKDAPEVTLKTVGVTKDPVVTMGGLKIIPDCSIDEIIISKENALILPGSNAWNEEKNWAIVSVAKEFISKGGLVAGICGATVALANLGILDNYYHTSNGVGFLDMFCQAYKGKSFYKDEPAVIDRNLVTASGTGGLLFAKLILKYLGVFKKETLEAWYQYYISGGINEFYALMGTLQ